MAASMCALALMALITLIELPDSFAFAIKKFILIRMNIYVYICFSGKSEGD